MHTALLALGANVAGAWGEPRDTLARVARELEAAGVRIVGASRAYSTAPLGTGRQARYLNAVIRVEARLGPGMLLRLVKGLERRAGRRLGRHWGPRPLDVDLLDWGGRRIGRPGRRRDQGRLILPHPEMHARAFVLVPLLEIAPGWVHPVLGVPGRTLLARLGARRGAGVQALDFAAVPCDKLIQQRPRSG
ncbi:MAG: 2-amino-4-hydroxy-6-hydroxymethyldihydropteridine diphosphokinase [Hyphomicrobiaceae bacterium]|nr:MAG: 2-amino-4-hydroxy-6-hydroxymethyldihydropteridine diphosphokinase [Hyphomicrobiaceae bacterium]